MIQTFKIALALACCTLLIGCSGGTQFEDLVGNWKVRKFDSNIDIPSLHSAEAQNEALQFRFVLNEDGTALVGREDRGLAPVKWMYNEEKNLLSFPSGATMSEQYKVISLTEDRLKLSFRVPDTGELFLTLKRESDYRVDGYEYPVE